MTKFDYAATYGKSDKMNVSAPGKESTLVFKVPEGKDKALVVKFLVDPRNGGKSYIPVKHYPHMVGPDPQLHTRSHLAQDLAGNGEDIELTARIGYYRELKALRETGSTDAARMQQLTRLVDRCKDKESGWFYIVEPGSSTIKAIKLGVSVVNQLFGRVYKDKEPIPSLIKAVSQKGISPYDLTSDNAEIGWFKIYSTGKGLGKKYHVELAEDLITKVVEGETFTKTQPARFELDKKIKNLDLSLEDFPDPMVMEVKQAFTTAETVAFIESSYSKVPDRFLTRGDGTVSRPLHVAPSNDSYIPSADLGPELEVQEVSLEDLPF